MWNPLKIEASDRFTAVETFFKANRKHSSEQTAKGIVFVQVYAAYEYLTRAVVQTAVDSIVLSGYRLNDLRPPLMALFLYPELESQQMCQKKRVWDARITLFEKLFSNAKANIPNTTFPLNGEHFRHSQLLTIFRIFGIKRSPAHRTRHLLRIDEVVGNRNDIAHGLLTADAVGRRYSRKEVLQTIRQMKSVCLLLVSSVEKQCADKRRVCRKP